MINHNKYAGMKSAFLGLIGAGALAVSSGCATGLAGSGAGYDYMSRDPTNHLNIKQRNAAGALSGLAYALASMKDNRALQERQWAHEELGAEAAKKTALIEEAYKTRMAKNYDMNDSKSVAELRADLQAECRLRGYPEETTQALTEKVIYETRKKQGLEQARLQADKR